MQASTQQPQIEGYSDFLLRKTQIGGDSGFSPTFMPDYLKDFQKHMVEWAIRKGRSALFEDCGMGKAVQGLVWGTNIVRHTNKPTLFLTPLAVSRQTEREAAKFGIEAAVSRDGSIRSDITITNYERLHHFDWQKFGGVVCDESSCLKNFDGKRQGQITEFMRKIPHRLLLTATAAPNDYVELGTSAEALGEFGYMDMLARFFVNENKTLHLLGTKHGDFSENRWRFKAHAEEHFWRWVCSWARACRKPSDLGYSDEGYDLPPLKIDEHTVKAARLAEGMLFEMAAVTLDEQREESRRTLNERCEKVAELLASECGPAVAWCQLNDESNLLERLIPGAKQITGSYSDDEKEELLEAFSLGQIQKLVTKPKMAGFGLNWQHCARMTFFPSHSFEQFYQAIRRSWRFGQLRPVHVSIVTTEGGAGILANLKRKSAAADEMFVRLVQLMNDSLRIGRTRYGNKEVMVPTWL